MTLFRDERGPIADANAGIGLIVSDRLRSSDWSLYPFPPVLLFSSLALIAATWFWLGAPTAHVPHLQSGKLDCVSYAPFRDAQDPLTPGLIIGEQQITEDFEQLAKITDCVRTYSTGNGLDQAPALAQRAGLKLLLGIWIGTQPRQNLEQIETAIALSHRYPDVVGALVVGNEVLLRREMTASDLAGVVRSVKKRVTVPVTYADVWDVWAHSREISDAVDFVTIHVLPYWDDLPVSAELAAAHVDSIRQRIATTFPGKDILIGETGWPSQGRMREGALPSPANQARVILDVLALARQHHFRVNLIEAYDQPWKRHWEGTVGAHWGLFDSQARSPKYPPGRPVRNHPLWEIQMYAGLAFCIAIFAVAGTVRQGHRRTRLVSWFAVAVIAAVGGVLLGMSIERLLLQGLGAGWIRCGLLLAVAIAAPLLCAYALMSGGAAPSFLHIMDDEDRRHLGGFSRILGALWILTTLIACESALGLVFDPRYRDFAFAPLTMAVLPYLILGWFNRLHTAAGTPPLAERIFSGLLGMSAFYILFNEGYQNWQSLWTCAVYLSLVACLWLVRSPVGPDHIAIAVSSTSRSTD